MAMSSKDLIAKEEIINKGNINDMLEYYGIEKKGNYYFCPFHNDKNKPNLSVTPDGHHWQCFTCGEGGDVVDLVEKMERSRGNDLNFRQRLDFVNKKLNLGVDFDVDFKSDRELTPEQKKLRKEYRIMYEGSQYAREELKNNSSESANVLAYLHSRGINDDTISHFEIGYDRNGIVSYRLLNSPDFTEQDLLSVGALATGTYGPYDPQKGRVIIPIKDANGNVVAFGGRSLNDNDNAKYKNTKSTDIFKKSEILFNYCDSKPDILKEGEVVIVEGYFDVISAYELGIKNVVGVMGAEVTSDHINLLKKLSTYKDDKEVTISLCLDNDEPGRQSMCKLIPKLMAEGLTVNVIDISKLNAGKDMNDLLNKKVPLEQIQNTKIPATEFLFNYTFDYYNKKYGEASVETINRTYNALFRDPQFNNSLNEERFKEYINKKYSISEEKFQHICHPENSSTQLSAFLQNVAYVWVEGKLEKYAEQRDDVVLRAFLADKRFTKEHILKGLDNDEYLEKNGSHFRIVDYVNGYLTRTPEYQTFKSNYDLSVESIFTNVFALDKSFALVPLSLTAEQKDIVMQQYKESFDDDSKQYITDNPRLFNRLLVADNADEAEFFLSDKYNQLDKPKILNEFKQEHMCFVNYGCVYPEDQKETLARFSPNQYTTEDGEDYLIPLIFNNSGNKLHLTPQNYIVKDETEDEMVYDDDEMENEYSDKSSQRGERYGYEHSGYTNEHTAYNLKKNRMAAAKPEE